MISFDPLIDSSTDVMSDTEHYYSEEGNHKCHTQTVAYREGGFGVFNPPPPPPRNFEDIGGVLDRTSKKNRRLDFLL